jgi:hypothetical protein
MVARFGIIRQIVDIERKLAETKFQQCGCIYFKEDFPHGDSLAIASTTASTTASSALERFTLGPLVDVDCWEKEKASMNLHRGPCKWLL